MTTTCPNRNYCDPHQPNCGDQNRGVTWFYTNQSRTCDDVNTCLGHDFSNAQAYCVRNAPDYGGGTFEAFCWKFGTCLGSDESNFICYKTSWDTGSKLLCCTGTVDSSAVCDPTWCPQNLDVCADVLSTYCATEQTVTDPTCVQFCSKAENKVYCDPSMRTHCTSHPEDPLCTCINAVSIPRPSCFDVACTETGYQTQEMLMDATNCGEFCGEFIDCVQAGNCNISNVAFQEKCGSVPPPTPSGGGFPDWVYIAIGIGLLAFVLIFGVYFLYRRYHRR